MEQISMDRKMQELAKRAQKRRIAFSAVKTDSDVVVENKTFEVLKADIYTNIVRSDS